MIEKPTPLFQIGNKYAGLEIIKLDIEGLATQWNITLKAFPLFIQITQASGSSANIAFGIGWFYLSLGCGVGYAWK